MIRTKEDLDNKLGFELDLYIVKKIIYNILLLIK
jgi:hypothetical protein